MCLLLKFNESEEYTALLIYIFRASIYHLGNGHHIPFNIFADLNPILILYYRVLKLYYTKIVPGTPPNNQREKPHKSCRA